MTDIAAIVGDPPGAKCGMGDFVGVMNAELERRGISTSTVLVPHLRASHFPRLRRELEVLQPKIIHFQFPSISLGKDPIVSLLPRVYRNAPWLITLCEFSTLNPLRQASLALLPRTFDGYIFTSTAELDHVARLDRSLPKRSDIIPAISNIRVAQLEAPFDETSRLRRVVYFGQIVPQRGIETFLEAAQLAKARNANLDFVLVGATPEWARDYWTAILRQAAEAGVETHLNVSEENASQLLSSAAFGYFPYPDGASLKRGTLPAAMGHGLFLATRWSAKTEPDVRAATIEAQGPDEAIAAIHRLQHDPDGRAALALGVTAFNRSYSVEAVTDIYIDFYKRFGFKPPQ